MGGSSSIRRGGKASPGRSIFAFGLALLSGLLVASAPASATALEHPFLETFGSANKPSFTEAQGMAVDQSTGDLLVIDAGKDTVSRFHENGTPSEFSALGGNAIEGLQFESPEAVQVAVDNSGGATNGNIYVTQMESKALRIFDKDGNPLGELTAYKKGPAAEGALTAFNAPCGVAVDPAGNVYVGEFTGGGIVHKYEPSGNPPVNEDNSANFPFAKVCTLAAGAEATDGFIFPAHLNVEGGGVGKLNSSTGAEQYPVTPGPTTTVAVDPGTGHLLVASGNEVLEFDASGDSEAIPLPPIAPGGEEVTGVAVNGATGNIYVARKGSAQIEVWGPAVALPEVSTEPASVIGDTVTLNGTVNPEGQSTTCLFEYVEVSANGFEGASTVPASPPGPHTGTSPIAVSAEVSGLAEAAYRYRLVCSNENGSSNGNTLFFNTFEAPGLPDGRAYELVSPPVKIGEVFPREPFSSFGSCSECLPGITIQMMPMQSTADGEAILYEGQPFSAGLSPGGDEYLARRGGAGWGTENLSTQLFASFGDEGYAAFSEDLSRGVLLQADPPLSPEAPNRGGLGFANLYLRDGGGTLDPLITEEPPQRGPAKNENGFRMRYAGANAGSTLTGPFTHVIFEANDALTELVPGIAPAAPPVPSGQNCAFLKSSCNLYEWVDGELRLVNVLPGNESAAGAALIGAGRLLAPLSDVEPPNVDNAISGDGSKVFWSSETTGNVYARIDGEETLEIPAPPLCKESVPRKERVCFQTASADGTRVLLSDGELFELDEGAGAYESIGDLAEGEGGFEGILGASEELSQIYFIDTAALTGESEENANGEHAKDGEFNLYSWEEGETTFIGVLTELDNLQAFPGRYGTWKSAKSNRFAQVTPDGRFLAFVSHASLTGYDNRRAGGGECVHSRSPSCNEVFVYDADSDTLVCASCNPSGERPIGHSVLSVTKGENGFFPFPQPGNLSSEGQGRLFFESQDTLTSGDNNGQIQDVYEWEPNGVGSCKLTSGCVYLISSGNSPNDSMFLESSASGNDAFFITREQLLPIDRNFQLDVYDARAPHLPGEQVGFPEGKTAPCSGEACAAPPTPAPVQPNATSGEFNGPGNPPKPKHHKKKKHKHKKKKHGKGKGTAKHHRGPSR